MSNRLPRTAGTGARPARAVEAVTQLPSSQTRAILRLVCLLLFLSAGLCLTQDYVIFPRLVRRGIHMHSLG